MEFAERIFEVSMPPLLSLSIYRVKEQLAGFFLICVYLFKKNLF